MGCGHMVGVQSVGMGDAELKDLTRTIVILFIFLLTCYFVLSWLALGPCFIKTILHQDTFVLAVGEGYSMYPIINDGDYIIIDVTPEDLKVGDVIVYYHDGELIGHRIIGVLDGGFITKGDNNRYPDPWIVKKNQVIGEVEWVIKDELCKWIAKRWFTFAE